MLFQCQPNLTAYESDVDGYNYNILNTVERYLFRNGSFYQNRFSEFLSFEWKRQSKGMKKWPKENELRGLQLEENKNDIKAS